MSKPRTQANLMTFDVYHADQLDKARKAIVTKATTMIQKTRYSLSLQEQKVLLFLISKIRSTDTFLTEYVFDIKDFCLVCGITATNYDDIKSTLLNFKKKSFWLTIDDKGTESCVDWFSSIHISKFSGLIRMKFHEDLHPYLLELRKNFTSFSLYPTLVMKSRYSIRLYELLKSYSNLSEWTFDLDDLKKMLDSSYVHFFDFRRRVLEVSISEINKYTELDISYQAIKYKSRQFNKIQFLISNKAPFFVLQAEKEVSKELDK